MNTEAHIADLQMIVDQLNAKLVSWTEQCQAEGANWTPEQEKKWEGAWMTLRGILVDDLVPCLESWKAGHPFSRRGEQIAARDGDLDTAITLITNGGTVWDVVEDHGKDLVIVAQTVAREASLDPGVARRALIEAAHAAIHHDVAYHDEGCPHRDVLSNWAVLLPAS